jgi:tRNA(Ile)-lysidine synthase TilS/MesJ
MGTRIHDFWLAHPEFWIAVGHRQAVVDKLIYDMFHDYDFTAEDAFGKVVYLDQFVRHFSRVSTVSEEFILQCRRGADTIIRENMELVLGASEQELVWYLMPWKHLEMWDDLFMVVGMWLNEKPVVDFPQLNKFFMDSYKKAYTDPAVAAGVVRAGIYGTYDAVGLCEVHPDAYDGSRAWAALDAGSDAKPLLAALKSGSAKVAISLSGGVDSMLMAALLKRSGADVVAIHILYGNRAESVGERNFISLFCARLGLPLYTYSIERLRRDCVERAFYESMTRDLRFSVYKAIGRPVLLGHIQEDVIENIWTNFAHGTHLDNLAKFEPKCVESGVTIYRPWLGVKKAVIYKVADMLAIPHLKNTTPVWSNRGKFRAHFYGAAAAQYNGSGGMDDKLIEVAARLKKQAEMLDKLLFATIRASWDSEERRINITQAVAVGLDADGWLSILTDLAHNKLGLKKPSFASCEEFVRRITKGLHHGDHVTFKKDFMGQIIIIDGQTWLSV